MQAETDRHQVTVKFVRVRLSQEVIMMLRLLALI